MASATNNEKSTEVKYCGPAGQKFSSLQKLAAYSMDNYFPNWRNYNDPKCYMIPSALNQPAMNDAKQMTFNAIQQLIIDGFQAPFILVSVCNLNIYKHADYFHHYFPIVPTEEIKEILQEFIHESDFVLIGRKIGIIIIKTVTSFDELSYNIASKNISVRSETLVNFLEKCTKLKISKRFKSQKILVAPKIEKKQLLGKAIINNHTV